MMRFLCIVLVVSSGISRVSGMQASSAKDLKRAKQMPDGDANGEEANDIGDGDGDGDGDSMFDSTTMRHGDGDGDGFGDANGEEANDIGDGDGDGDGDSMFASTPTRPLPNAAAQLNANGDVTNGEVRRHATSDDGDVFVEMDANGVIDAATGQASVFSATADAQGLPKPMTVAERETNRATVDFLWGMIQMKGKDYSDTFCSRSKDNCATVTGYPGPNSHSELKFAKVVEELPKVPKNEESGKIRRLGDLGYLIMNDMLWTKDWKVFPIGADFGDHRKARPILDALQGANSKAWNTDAVRASVAEFFKGRTQLTYADYSGWTTKFFHKIMLDLDLSEAEVKEFEDFKASVITLSVLPRWLAKTFRWALSLKKTQDNRDKWLAKYVKAMEADQRGIIPEDVARATTDEKKRDRRFLADLLVTSVTSAGGLSTPTVIQLCLGVLYGGKNSPLAEADRKLTETTLRPFVYEAIRRFPVVVGFPWWTPDQSKRTVLNLAMALRDPDAWGGEDAMKFKIRPLSEYHAKAGTSTKIGVAWAQQSRGPDGVLTPDSRGCPGQELAMVMITEFLRHAFLGKQGDWYVSKMPEGGVKITEGPSGASSFTLTKGSPAPVTYVPLAPAKKPTTDEEAGEGQGGGESGGAKPTVVKAKFHCPAVCQECCQKDKWLSSSWYQRQDETKFHCIMAADKAAGFKIDGRTCSEAKVRDEDSSQAVATCDLTTEEKKAKLHADLHKCTYHKLVRTFGEFLGRDRIKDYCTVSYAGTLFGLRAIGGVIESQLFTVSDRTSGGVSGTKPEAFAEMGMMDKLCADASCKKPTTDEKTCVTAEQASLKKMLNADVSGGRIDRAAMAIWAGVSGAQNKGKSFPKPEQTRLLKKFTLPGWSSKKVVYETLDGDVPINLVGGGFQCMIEKIIENKINDDFGSGRNEYAASGGLSEDAWFTRRRRTQPQCVLPAISAPSKPADVRYAYFDRYGIYQKPFHFPIPDGELQSDKTLERLVFEAIGAHHLEPIVDGKLINLSPVSIGGLPRESAGLIAALPSATQKDASYIVRMEGLFDKTPVRPGMGAWGGNAFFSAAGKLVAIQYRGKTVVKGAPEWQAYKYFFRCSLLGMVTAFDHLAATHILVSNALAVATQETLTEDHPLRHILTPHTWGTLTINMQAANVLFPKQAWLQRIVPFSEEAFEAAGGGDGPLWKMTASLKFTKFMDLYAQYTDSRGKISGAPEIPFFEDGVLIYKTLHDYFKSAVAFIYSEDATQCNSKLKADKRAQSFVENFWSQTEGTPDFYPAEFKPEQAGSDCGKFTTLLTELVFHVTGIHKHVGTVADFFRDTAFGAMSWKEGETVSRPKHTMMLLLMAASTDAAFPKLNEGLCDIYSNDVRYRELFGGLKKGMEGVQTEVEKRNAKRVADGRLAFRQMEPKYMEWGVQV